MIQTETGAREGVLNASQIDNLSVVGRSSLELLRILPGVVAPDNTAFESGERSAAARTTTNAYTVNGIRSSNNNVSLDGSQLIDIGSNSGVIVTLNNDMVQEVKVQSSNFAAEYGSGGMNISAVTKGGGSRFSGTVYDYWRDHRFAANDRSNSIAGVDKPKSSFNYPGGNVGGPIVIPGLDFNKNRDKAFFFFGLEVQRQKNDPGRRFGVVPTLKQRAGDFSEFLSPNGQNLNQPVGPNQIVIPAGFPGAGAASSEWQPHAVHHAARPGARELVSRAELRRSQQPLQLRAQPAGAAEPPRYEGARRLEHLEQHQGVRARGPREGRSGRRARCVVGRLGRRAAVAERRHEHGRSVSGNVVTVLSPTMTNEALVSWSRLTLDNAYKDPVQDAEGRSRRGVRDVLPGREPVHPAASSSWGGGVSNMWSSANDMYAHNDELTFSNKLTKIAGAHGLKFGGSRVAAAEAAELPEQRGSLSRVLRSRVEPRHLRQRGRRHPGGASDAGRLRHGSAEGRVPDVELRRVRPGLVEAASEPDARVRHPRRLLDQQRRAERSRAATSTRRPTTRPRRSFWIRARSGS